MTIRVNLRSLVSEATVVPRGDRRRHSRGIAHGEPNRRDAVSSILGAFREMPGLSLYPSQAARLFGLRPPVCELILTDLVVHGELRRDEEGQYVGVAGNPPQSEPTVCPFPSSVTADDTRDQVGTSQTLWHVERETAPQVTAVLTRAADDDYRLDVTFGAVAHQHLRFRTALAAVERADRLFAHLEEAGFRRRRPDRRALVERSDQRRRPVLKAFR